MYKKQPLNLNIPHPCDKDWDKMTPVEKGRHCSSCSTTVFDFTNYTDKELVEFVANWKGSCCGRFYSHQLNRPLAVTEPVHRSFLYKLFYGTAIAAWLTGTANAQSTDASTNQNVQPVRVLKNPEAYSGNTWKSLHPADSTHYIAGTVTDFAGNPLSDVKVSDSLYTFQAVTDVNGHFRWPVPDNLIGKKITLYFNNKSPIKVKTKQLPVILKHLIEIQDIKTVTHQNGRFL